KSKRCRSAEAAASAATRGKRRELRGVEAGGTTLTSVQCGNSSGWQLLEKFEQSEHRLPVESCFTGTKVAAGLTGRRCREGHSLCSAGDWFQPANASGHSRSAVANTSGQPFLIRAEAVFSSS